MSVQKLINETPPGHWRTARQNLTCRRCACDLLQRRKYYATPSNCYCAWCANEVWGVTMPRKKAGRP